MKVLIKAYIFFVRLPVPDYRKAVITTYVSNDWTKEQIEDRIAKIAHERNNEITIESIRKINFKEVKSD